MPDIAHVTAAEAAAEAEAALIAEADANALDDANAWDDVAAAAGWMSTSSKHVSGQQQELQGHLRPKGECCMH